MNLQRDPKRLRQKAIVGRQKNVYSIFWNLIALFGAVSGIFIFVGCALDSWRVNKAITVHTLNSSSSVTTYTFNASKYGLYLFTYNGGTLISTWFTVQSNLCQLTGYANIVSIFTNCSTECTNHFYTRCNAYKRLHYWGIINLSILILAGCLSLTASGIIYFCGPMYTLLQLMWIGGAVLASILVAVWVYLSNEAFNSLNSMALYPFPTLGSGFYITIAGLALMFLCGTFTFLQSYYMNLKEWRLRQEKIANKICMQTQYEQDNFGLGAGVYAKSTVPTYAKYNNAPLKYAYPSPQAFSIAGPPQPYQPNVNLPPGNYGSYAGGVPKEYVTPQHLQPQFNSPIPGPATYKQPVNKQYPQRYYNQFKDYPFY